MTLQKNPIAATTPHWADVKIGDAVQLRRNGHPVHAGRVDDRTANGAVVWVVSDGGHRQLFHIEDGYQLTAADLEGAGNHAR